MAGYSGTPLAQKLGINENARVFVTGAPIGFIDAIEGLPAGVEFVPAKAPDPVDVAIVFVRTVRELQSRFRAAAAKLSPAGGLWVSWPKKSSGVLSEVSENDIRAFGLAEGLVDNKVCAINDVWSGLRFVIRVKDRPA